MFKKKQKKRIIKSTAYKVIYVFAVSV